MNKRDPEGYKKLLVYKKADELHELVLELAERIKRVEREKRVERAEEEKRVEMGVGMKGREGEERVEGGERERRDERIKEKPPYTPSSHSTPFNKILLELADQLGRAARSPKSNIVEGWKRNTTSEYYTYLGFSIASAEEIKEDATDIIRGKYKELMGERGIMGGKGEVGKKGITGGKGVMGNEPSAPSTLSVPLPPLNPLPPFSEIEKLPFYPLDPLHPFVVQIYLRCKELTMLLDKLQKSLDQKMSEEGTLPSREKLKNRKQEQDEAEKWLLEATKKLKKEKEGE